MRQHLNQVRNVLLASLVIVLSVPVSATGQSASTSKTYGASRGYQKPTSTSPGRYRSQGRYRGAQPQRTPTRKLPRAQPGSLIPGDFGYGYRQTPSPYVGYDKPAYGYRYNSPGYVVYVPSSTYPPQYIEEGRHYASQPLQDTSAPNTEQQPIYIVVQAPETPQPVAAPAPPAPTVIAPPPPAPPRPVSREPGEVQLMVQPSDSLVYIDERLLGTAAELEDFDNTLTLSPGIYVLKVEHSNLSSQRLIFSVRPGQPQLVEIDLLTDDPNQRSRLTSPDDLPLFLGKK